jgi:hypothetical protein
MDNKKEYLTSCSLSMPVNIPVATVAPLPDMLENIEIPYLMLRSNRNRTRRRWCFLDSLQSLLQDGYI